MNPSLRALVKEIAGANPHRQALLACAGKLATYDDLIRQIDATVRSLTSAGIERGDRVAAVMPNGAEMASLFLGIASVSTCAPLNPAYRESEFEFYLSDLKPKLMIVDAALD